MEYKYIPTVPTRKPRPKCWITGPDELTREKFYAWHKHRAQANYRQEEYSLTFDDWQQLWSDDNFLNRGRASECLVLTRIEREGPWSIANCEVITRLEQLRQCVADKICGRGSSNNPNRVNKSKKKSNKSS